ncbi:DUF2290 domain-containing protein [Cobetia sp. UCD-24C]|uniref:DUF2290 domain-containing protein n=1 Tax=Cobetia sp. UCD-24C TaxID=1716176 RepID=UPI0019106AE2|nr:DUF2290 domain-containing protein [Cobetia sp. UCD-24C]
MKIATPVELKKEVDQLISCLIESALCDDSNFTSLREAGGSSEVTFLGAEYISIALGESPYCDIYNELAENRSYNVKFIDGALLQMMYRLEGGGLVQHRLAFYPSPHLSSFQKDGDDYMRDEIFIDIIERNIVPFPLRFDFDAREGIYSDIVHPKSHLTLGDVKGCRIPVSAPLTPRWFLELIIRNFYQSDKYEFLSTLPRHKIKFPTSITNNELKLMHMVVPY